MSMLDNKIFINNSEEFNKQNSYIHISFNDFIKIAYQSLQTLNFNSINSHILNSYKSFNDNQKFNLENSELSLYISMLHYYEKNSFSKEFDLFSQFNFVIDKSKPSHITALNNNHMSSQYEYFKLFLDYCYSNKYNINDFKYNPVIRYFYSKFKNFEKKKIAEYSYIIPEIIKFQNEFNKI